MPVPFVLTFSPPTGVPGPLRIISQPDSEPAGTVTLTAFAFAGLSVFVKSISPAQLGRVMVVCWSFCGAHPEAASSFTV